MMDDPCASGCIRGHGDRCHARTANVRRFCELIAAGDVNYARLVDRLTAGIAVSGPPYASPDAFLAPLRPGPGSPPVSMDARPWEGSQAKKPWEYRVTAAVIHLDTPGLLAAVLATLRAQDERPYLCVVDSGSLAPARDELGRMELEADDLEVHYMHPRAWRYTSQPVAVGMDLAFACCQTEYLYATHTDVFLKRPSHLSWLLARCDAATPVVGYQMSPRAWANDFWRATPSHAASLYHMPTMRAIGATWNMTRAAEILGMRPEDIGGGNVDTESMIGLCLREAGIGMRWMGDPDPGPTDPPSWLAIGPEPNTPYEDDNLVHERSTTCRNLYVPDGSDGRRKRVERAAAEAIARAESWVRRAAKPRVPLGSPRAKG